MRSGLSGPVKICEIRGVPTVEKRWKSTGTQGLVIYHFCGSKFDERVYVRGTRFSRQPSPSSVSDPRAQSVAAPEVAAAMWHALDAEG
jgi:hypothetical protein